MEQDKPPRKPPVRFTPVRRAAALRAMGETGNRRAAAEAAGVDVTTVEYWLRKDAAFAAEWAATAEAVNARLAAARSPSEGVADGRFETIQRSRTGRLQIQAVREKRWTKAIEDRFFGALRTCGNVAACARLIGFSEAAIWQRREKWPAFGERMERALDEAEIALEFRLAAMGSTVGAGIDPDADADGDVKDGALDCRGAGASRNDEVVDQIPFDPEFALKFLKWREEKRRGRTKNRGAAAERLTVTAAELDASIQRKLAILRKRNLAKGGTEDENGHLIPPGWVRSVPPPSETGATDPPSH